MGYFVKSYIKNFIHTKDLYFNNIDKGSNIITFEEKSKQENKSLKIINKNLVMVSEYKSLIILDKSLKISNKSLIILNESQ